MEIDLEARIVQLLLRAARHRKLVPYGRFHAIFPLALPLSRRYIALEHAAASICNLQLADYASLLCTDSGLPGPDFYARFRRLHAERYYTVLGADRNRKLRLVEKQRFAGEVREQVYRHARAAEAAAPSSAPGEAVAADDRTAAHPARQAMQSLALTTRTLCAAVVVAATAAICSSAAAQSVDTRIGKIELIEGVPANAAVVQKLFDESDFQRAAQAYVWALPIVGFAQWQADARSVFGAKDTDMVIYESVQDKFGILTANATTPYIVGLPDLSKTGPLVIDYPAGNSAGGIGDFWQRPLTDLGETGPDQGKGGKYLVVGPGQAVPEANGYRVIHSPTVNIFVAFRALDADPAKADALIQKFHLYPYADRTSPASTRFLRPDGRKWSQVPPRGLAYWERLDDIVQREPVLERDRVMMGLLQPVGIEKGKPFAPDERQRKILEEGAQVGELFAQANAFDSRAPGSQYRPGAQWRYVIGFDASQESKYYTAVDARAEYFYQAVTTSNGMTTKTPGVGQAYLGVYRDKSDQVLDGSKNYVLHVPANPPAKLFWSLTVYDTDQRVLIDNGKGIAGKSSREELVKNADGTVDLYVGPDAPAGKEKNWIPSVPRKAWFAMFRLYGPLQPYFDAAFALPDFERVN
jgi:hypothetical protein